MRLYTITGEYSPPVAAFARIDDDRYDLVWSGAAGKPNWTPPDQLLSVGIRTRSQPWSQHTFTLFIFTLLPASFSSTPRMS